MDYDTEYQKRIDRLLRLRAAPEILKGIKEHYKENPIDFINDWGLTYDPRNPEIGLPAVIPFILFPHQEEFVTWVYERWTKRENGLAEKSRDMGVSWLCVAIAVHMWLFYDGVVVGFGSRKEEYVDKLGDPKSLFWKIREFINYLPQELQPEGWNPRAHAPHMRILNPVNGSAIVGESGSNIGRGNRASIYFKDESAFYEQAEAIDAALSQTTNCQIDVSTPNGNGNVFYRKRHSGKVPVFTFHWKQDPRKDEAWYQKQKEKYDPIIIAQEIDIDYNASTSDAWISGDSIAEAQRTLVTDIEAIGGWIIGVDAAHYGDDESVLHKRKGRLNLPQKSVRGVDGIQLAGIVEEEVRTILRSGGVLANIVIELDGPGVSCYDQLRKGIYRKQVLGIHTGAKQADDINYNLKAKLWRMAKEYLEDKPVHLPDCGELKSQLASVRYLYKDGLLLMQSKKDYKKAYGKSSDRADAFVLTFAANDRPTQMKTVRANTNWQL